MIGDSAGFGRNYSLFLIEYRTVGAVRRSWNREYPGLDRFRAPFELAIDTPGPFQSDYSGAPLRGPRWGVAEALRADPLAFAGDGMEHATGWPVLAAWYGMSATYLPNAIQTTLDGAIMLETRKGSGAYSIRALPLHPIWPGLLIDTAFYATLWLILLAGLRATRRAYRRARNRCPNCAYHLTGLAPANDTHITCPECGKKQRTLPAATPSPLRGPPRPPR
jgi:hypothetical protein